MRAALRSAALAAAALLLAGCATEDDHRLYRWGDYDKLLVASRGDAARVAELRDRLAEQVAAVEAGGKRVGPGLYGDLGTLYLQAGDRARALQNYRKERDAWPESRVLMDALIARLGGPAARSGS